ncbi:hypothetical protein EST38_g5656 [Candolleomyces aberdarensis]|uniref:Extracellular membrane protein CFEM domain-containing protein n=1 Tax=Candolleomyces aberdarensis TaxID=2316362 RepID=A0A4Q2DLM4_9AGAR|nr:hypothetical protein EST38_g5656 [Candolleomyces aberdarensis]
MHLKAGFISMVFTAATVSAATLQGGSTLIARGPCTDLCNLISAADTQCKAESNYDKCFCTATNLMHLDNCYACLVMGVEANAETNSLITGDSTAIGADSIKADGEKAHKQFLDGCKASGFALNGSNESGKGVSGTMGTTAGSSTTTGTTVGISTASNNAGFKLKELGGASLLVLTTPAWSLL